MIFVDILVIGLLLFLELGIAFIYATWRRLE